MLIFDAGTGIRGLAKSLMGAKSLELDLFFTHTHFDHVCGFPFFAPAFEADTRLRIWAGHLSPERKINEVLGYVMREPLWPVQLEYMAAKISFCDFIAGEVLRPKDGIVVRTTPLNHTNGATGYRIEYDDRSICYITDTEHFPDRLNQDIVDLIKGTDIFIYDWEHLFSVLPLAELDKAAGKDMAFFRDWVNHPDYTDYWRTLANEERYQGVQVPVLQIGGWYDFFTAGTLHNFVGMRERGGSELARANQRVVMGPWVHGASRFTHAGDVDFGKGSVLDLNQIELRWFDHWLKGIDNGITTEPPLRLFIMGTGQWRDEDE